LNTRERNPFLNNRAWHYPKHIDDTSLENMRLAAKMLEGTHDFSSYMAANSSVSTTVRTVYSTDVYRENDTIIFKVSADGFLYNMVRIFTGTLIAVAEGRIAPSEIASITDAKDRTRAGVTAPPQGLYLNKVNY
jgi:tRNA pseudouridine38-40 synthase